MRSEIPDTGRAQDAASRGIAWYRLRVAGLMLGSLLLGLVAIWGPVLLVVKGLIPLVDTAFHPGADVLSAIRRIGIFLAAVLGYWAYVRWFETREATELALRPISLVLGGVSGVTLVALPIAALFAFGVYEVVLFRGISSALAGVAVLIVIAATLEELVFRCLLFRLLERAWGTWAALVVSSVVFALRHLENVTEGGVVNALTMIVAVIVVGLLWAGVFILTRNLWAVVFNHAAWNFTILLSGVPLSGIEDWRAIAPIESRYAGPDWLTGGMFGPENSLLVIVLTAVMVALLLRLALLRGAFLSGQNPAQSPLST